MKSLRGFAKIGRLRWYNSEVKPQVNTNGNVQAEPGVKVFTSEPGNKFMDDDEEELVVVSEETEKLGKDLAAKALGIATLLNVIAGIAFVLWCRYYWEFKSIAEFKVALNSRIMQLKEFLLPTVSTFQESGKDIVNSSGVKEGLKDLISKENTAPVNEVPSILTETFAKLKKKE